MNAGQSNSQHEVIPAGRMSQNKRAVLSVVLTVIVSLAAIVLVRPRVGSWLEVRSAYRNLSSADYDDRIDAIRHLRSLGQETESELIALLHHPDNPQPHRSQFVICCAASCDGTTIRIKSKPSSRQDARYGERKR
jgi:hypothetical protein